ncbi:hypothetical protein LWI29_026011 [Acer saccharum]|uniref:Uncharacterized protein n=1 Tax=Acer saccharum TaxID=4024 RepID=A0AA39VLJ7_ACESA|nr:hypothetical protein LWI29_026011 [Acer saccharum]
MCLCLMLKLKGNGPPTPREIRHFYTPRQAGNGGTYFLLSSPVENWIPEGVVNPGQVEVSSDEKKKARTVKNSEAANKRHAAGLAKEGIAGPDGDDPSDGEDAGDVTRGEVESGQPSMRAEAAATIPVAAAAATTPNRKGKEKVGVSGGVSDIPFFDADVPETPLDPASDLAPRASRSKRPAGSTPDHAARPPKRASRVVQYVISSDEEGAKEPAVAETSSTQPAIREGPVEADNVVAPPSEEVNEQTIPASTSPRTASPSVVMGEPNVSSDQPRPSGQPESIDRPGPSKQPGTSASSSGFSHETPPAGPVEAD